MRSPALVVAATSLIFGCAEIIGLTEDYHEAPAETGGRGGQGGETIPTGGSDEGGTGGTSTGGVIDDGSAANIEIPDGKLVFHRFTSYFTGDSEMFVVDFPSGESSPEIGITYGLCNPMNGIFSPDGNALLVAATERGGDPCGPTDRNPLEVYWLDLTQPGEKELVTQNTGVPDEDPQFSPDGSLVLLKHGDHIVEWVPGSAPVGSCASPTAGTYCYDASAGEQSKPVITADGRICYFEGSDAAADIYCFDRTAGKTGALLTDIRLGVVVRVDVFDGRPAILGDYMYFQRWRSATNKVTYIARKPLDDLTGVEEGADFCTDEGSSYRDPASIGGSALVFSGNLAGKGGADLFVARFDNESIASLDRWAPGVNTSKQELGASFWFAP